MSTMLNLTSLLELLEIFIPVVSIFLRYDTV